MNFAWDAETNRLAASCGKLTPLRHEASVPSRRPEVWRGADKKDDPMRLPRRHFLRIAAGAAALPALPRRLLAQTYPTRPVRMIVPFAPGGPVDVCTRLVAQRLSERLGSQFYVENVPGAGGNIGAGQAAKARPDGYTVLLNTNNQVINPSLFAKVPYDPFKDFDAVTLMTSFASAFSVNPSVPAGTVVELVALVKANPGKYSFASAGLGTPSHLLAEQFRASQGLDMVHVPYGGSGPAILSTVAGHTPIAFAGLSAAAPQALDGKLRVLAVMSNHRAEGFPDAPTIAEAGYPGMDGDGWIGMFIPAGTPKDIISLLHGEVARMMSVAAVKEQLATLGLDPVANTPEQFDAQLRLEVDKWSRIIRAANIRPQ
jgi:tripartite-type tricarboxylate transporter receptor subunit TctC